MSPSAEEHRRVQGYCQEHGIDPGHVRFLEGTSDVKLPALGHIDLDWALIDGAHSFPHAILDWHFTSRQLRVGGTLVLDDVPVPAVGVLFRHLAADPAWKLRRIVDDRAAVFQKVGEEPRGDPWPAQPFNRGYPDYSFLPLAKRLPLGARRLQHELRRRASARFPSLRVTHRRGAGR